MLPEKERMQVRFLLELKVRKRDERSLTSFYYLTGLARLMTES